MLTEDLARLRVNEAIRSGLEAQRTHRALAASEDEPSWDRPMLTGPRQVHALSTRDRRSWIRNLLRVAMRVAGILKPEHGIRVHGLVELRAKQIARSKDHAIALI